MYSTDTHGSRRLVLPFYNPRTDVEGVQFGMPPIKEAEMKGFTHSILILSHQQERTRCRRVDFPKLTNPPGEPPKPIWLWANVGGQWHKVGRPEPGDESAPLSELEASEIRWAPDGDSGDLTFGRRIQKGESPMTSVSEVPIEACGHELATAVVRNGIVEAIKPTGLAREMKLWTSHLIQLTQVRIAQGASQPKREP